MPANVVQGLFQDLPERCQYEHSDQSPDDPANHVSQTMAVSNHPTSSSFQPPDSYLEPFHFSAALGDFESSVLQHASRPAPQHHRTLPSAQNGLLLPPAPSSSSGGGPSSSTPVNGLLEFTMPDPLAYVHPSQSSREHPQLRDCLSPVQEHRDLSETNHDPSDLELADFLLAFDGNDGPMFGVMPSSVQLLYSARDFTSPQPSGSAAHCANPSATVNEWSSEQ